MDPDNGHDSVIIADLAYFNIDPATGQLMVKKKLSFEVGGEEDGEYTVVVRATDPSGEIPDDPSEADPKDIENRDEIVVKVVATDVPRSQAWDSEYGLTELWVNEADSTDDGLLPRSSSTWSIL